MYILVIGTPVDGFRFEGLFTNETTATEYGELAYPNTEWWVAQLVLRLKTGFDYGESAGEPTTVIKVIEDEPTLTRDNFIAETLGPAPLNTTNNCSCGHLWADHTQNVHGTWVCTQCNCRNMNNPTAST